MADAAPASVYCDPRLQGGSAAGSSARALYLADCDILDTQAEQGYDDIVLLATRLCETPVALISLLDARRQWFKARIGFEPDETPLSQSVCYHGLTEPGLLIIPDLTLDPRTRDNTLVTGPPFTRFYAGARLEAPDGTAIGMLCVIDATARPQGLRPDQATALSALARQVMAQLELRRVARERELLVQEAHHRVTNSLQMVQSLLTLQARTTTHPQAAQQLRESAMRVHAFGTMHEHLYKVDRAMQVELGPYLGALIDKQRMALVSTFEGREVAFHAEPARWPAADAPTVGLILMELVTNALKYGRGLIGVSVREVAGEIVLRVADEGELPAGFEPASGSGLGMRLLLGLLRGRQGQLQVDASAPQTCFIASLRASPQPTSRTE